MSAANTNRNVYEDAKVAQDYEQMRGLNLPEQLLFQKYFSLITGKNILDIGCGAGRTTEYLLPIAGDYIGIDYSDVMVSRCKARFPQAHIEVCDVREMSRFSANQFDFILFSFNGIDYISHEDRIRALHEIDRILAEDGYFMFSTHNREVAGEIAGPTYAFSLHPKRLARNLYTYWIARRNRKLNLHKQSYFDHYAILNDPAHDYALMTYYISPNSQVAQLRENGFQVIDQASIDGELYGGAFEDAHSKWLYYLCKKTSQIQE